MTKNLRKKTEQRENMERIRNSRGIPLTFKYLITIIILIPRSKGTKDLLTPTSLFCLSVKNVTMNRFDGYIQTIHRKKP